MDKLRKDLNLNVFERNSEDFVRISLSQDRDLPLSTPITGSLPEDNICFTEGYYNHHLVLGLWIDPINLISKISWVEINYLQENLSNLASMTNYNK